MTNAELIAALRCDLIRVHCKHDECQYYTKDGWCNDRTMATDAADALEAADKRIAELSLDCEMYQQKCMELDAKMKTVTDCHALEEENDE